MAPMRMKLRVRRPDNAAAAAGDQPEEEEEEEEEEQRVRRRGSGKRKKTAAAAAAAAPATPAAASWSPPPPPPSSSARAAMAAAEEASPDSKCPICLDRFNNLAYLDRCLHRFCFPCIQEWSHNKAECPLCKQPFASILHSVRAEDDFKEYTLRPPPANSSVAATVAMVAAMASAARSDHQMRLMLRRHRGDGDEATSRRRRRGGRRAGVWEWYLDAPPLALPPLPRHEDSEEEEGEEPGERRTRGGADPSERGVIFEGLTGLGGAALPAAPNDRAARRLMTRLAARRRLQREGGAVRRLRERETVAFRRALYRNAIRVRAGGGVTSQQRDITAESFRRNPTHLNRLRPWLRRELTVLYGAHASLVDIVQRIIMARVARHGLEDTPTIEEELRQFLLARTDHFLHELVSFARSPLSLENYDLQAAYEPPDAAVELDGTSSSSDGSSVIAISEGEEEEGPAGGRSAERTACGARDDDDVQAGSGLSLATWDDETPGPSYSTAEPVFGHAPREAANEEEGGGDKEEEECLIVGYKKPIAERTPELVQLSSDSEEEEKKMKTTEELPPLPPATPPLSYLPTIPPSTSGAFAGEPKEKDGSWSSSLGSGNSVCALSPAAPAESERKSAGGGETEREKKKRRRGRERSGTLYNPNRSIFPAMMRHRSHSSSPFHSSGGSPDSTWEFHCSQVSPLASSVSSPSRCSSSSSSSSSPPAAAPMPSLSPDGRRGEKPGGKRKYKSRHLDSDDRDPTWRPSSREKEARRRRRESRSRRADRSPSVEIIYEGVASPNAAQTPARKRRRKRQRRTPHSSSPVIITLDSDSSLGAASSSSPISSQQTVDFSDLPPLPSVHSDGVGGALGAEIGELPVDILDRGSEGSEVEPLGRSAAARPVAVEDSDDDVDVESVEDSGLLMDDEDEDDEGPMGAAAAIPRRSRPMGEKDAASAAPIGASSSDSRLLASILDDLKGIAAPKRKPPPVNFDPRPGRLGDRCDGAEAHSDQKRGFFDSPALERLNESSAREEVKEVPPLLKQASPGRPYNRNTPPPLKHKDAGSPHRTPVDPHSPHAAGSVRSRVDLTSNPVDARPEDTPPWSPLKRRLAVHGIDSTSHEPPAGAGSSSGSGNRSISADCFSHLELNSSALNSSVFHLHSSRDGAGEMSPPSPVDSHPGNSLSAVDFHSAKTGRSEEKPAVEGETGRTHSRLVAPDLHPSSRGRVSSGVRRYDSSPPAFVSSVDFRTRDPSPPRRKIFDGISRSRGRPEPTAAPGDSQPPPRSPVDLLHPPGEEPPVVAASSVLDRGAGSPRGQPLNHSALSSFDSHSKLLQLRNHFDPGADSRFPVDSRPKNSRRDLRPDDRAASSPESGENRWTSNASADRRSDSQSPVEERWNTHTHSPT